MKYCTSCGNPLDDNAKFCSVCGTATATQTESQPKQERKDDFRDKIDDAINSFTNTADTTADYPADDIAKNKVMAVLSYIGLLVLVPLFLAKESPFARYHTNQGLLLLIFHVIGSACGVIPFVGALIAAVANILWLVMLVIGILNAIKGEAKELPIIGKYRILK